MMSGTDTNEYFIEREGHVTLRVAPPTVHNFRLSRAVLRRDENERWRLRGTVIGGSPANDPEGFEAAVLQADIAWDNFLLMHLNLTNRTWVLNLEEER